MLRRRALALLPAAAVATFLRPRGASAQQSLRVLRRPDCDCCEAWAEHLREAGFVVTLEDTPALDAARRAAGVPDELAGCHTGVIADGALVVEGHVPAFALRRFLAAPGAWRGIAVPGMPIGSPGMESPRARPRPYVVYVFDADGRHEAFALAVGDQPA